MKLERKLIAAPLLLLLMIPAVGSAASASFTIDQVMSAPFATSPLAAPVGARVAWLLNERGQRNVWVASAPDWKGQRITNFTRDDGQEIAELAWAPDGTYLLFTRGGDFETGGDNPNPDLSPEKPEQAIWSVAMDGSPAKKLTDGHSAVISPKGDMVAFLRAGQIFVMKPSGEGVKSAINQKATATDLIWSPDGAELAFVSGRRDHSFIGIYNPSDKALRYLDASTDRDSDPVWSPDGARIAYLRTPGGGRGFGAGPRRQGEPWSIRIADPKSGIGHQVFRAKSGAGSVFHRLEAEHQVFWGANDRLIFPWEQTGWCHLYSIPATGESAVELTPGDGEVEHVAMSHDGKLMYYSANFEDIDRRHLWNVGVSGNPAPKMITRGENIEWQPAPLADGSALVFLASSFNERAHAAVRNSDGSIKLLAPAATPAEFPAASLVRPEAVMITSADGMQIHGQLFLPQRRAGDQRHPALVFFHGGSRRQMLLGFHYMDYYSNAYSLNQYFANQGYVVLSVNYRSGIGYGLNFREAVNYGARGASEFNDVIGAGLYLKSRSDVDPKRIGVWGGSYGGYLTALALSRASDLFAVGVDFHGVHDWSTLRDGGAGATSGDPDIQREQEDSRRIAFESSPIASVKTWRSPVLLIHGDDDRNVAFSQDVELVAALRKQHVDFEELIIPNEIHGFLMHRHWLEAYKATADFFGRKLQPNQETAGTH